MVEVQTFVIANRCNLACTYCWYETGAADYADEGLGVEAYRSWLVRCAAATSLRRAIVSGGEPTLREDFAELLDLFHLFFPEVVVLSNAVLLPRLGAVVEQFARLGTLVHVSLDHVSPSISDRIRGGTKQTLQGLNLLANAGVETQVTYILTAHNASDLPAVVDYCRKRRFSLEVNAVAVPDLHPLSLSRLRDDERLVLVEQLRGAADLLGRAEYYYRLGRFLSVGRISPLAACRAVESGVFIEASGRIQLCGQRAEDVLGDIRTSTVDEILGVRARVLSGRAAGPCVSLDCLTVA